MAVSDEIKNEIKAIYNADVTAIQNLSDIANKLQTGGYTCPGDYSVTGVLKVKNRDILAELDTLNSKTKRINLPANTTEAMVVPSSIYCFGLWTEGDHDISIGGVSGIRDLHARVKALEQKCQFITTVVSTEPTKTPNTMTLSSRVIIDCQNHEIPNVQPSVALIIKNNNELNILNRENTSKIAFFNGSRPRMWSPDTGTRWIKHTDE
jgi:hypothetical protein